LQILRLFKLQVRHFSVSSYSWWFFLWAEFTAATHPGTPSARTTQTKVKNIAEFNL
jgi:hypothetical protein